MNALHFSHVSEIDAALARTSSRDIASPARPASGGAPSDGDRAATAALRPTESDTISHPAPLGRFAVTSVAIVEAEDVYEAQETIGRALLDSPVRSVVILEVEEPAGDSVRPLALHHQPAAQAFHALNNAAQILRGDLLDAQDTDRARELIGHATERLGELYLELIRAQRHVKELRDTRAFLDLAPSERRALTSGGK